MSKTLDKSIFSESVTPDGKLIVRMRPYEELSVRDSIEIIAVQGWPLWALRLARWLKLTSWHPSDHTVLTECVVDPTDIVSQIIDAVGSKSVIWSENPTQLYLGRRQMAMLVNSPEYDRLIDIHQKLRGEYRKSIQVMGYTLWIKVLPYMDGIFII